MLGDRSDDERARVRRGVVSLFVANSASFAVVGLSYLAYSRLLDPEELGLYAAALVVGTFGTMVLDAGLKNTIIKAPAAPDREQLGVLATLLVCVSAVLVALVLASEGAVACLVPRLRADYHYLVLFGAIYVVSYPFVMLPTAMLERDLRYAPIAWIESLGMLVERAAPIAFLLATSMRMDAFVWALALGRAVRVVGLWLVEPVRLRRPRRAVVKALARYVREGAWLQLAMAASLVRDNLHVLLIAPWFGKQWTGYYAWGLQLCVIASQAFVQIASRISIPLFAREPVGARRWSRCLAQVEWLAILVGPLLVGVYLVMPWLDANWFASRWQPALVLLPCLFVRMLASVATTPLGAYIMVQHAGRSFARRNLVWAALEIAGAALVLALAGWTGLAWSYALIVWPGLWLFSGGSFGEVLRAILVRPGIALALVLAIIAQLAGVTAGAAAVPIAIAAVLAGYLAEPRIRKLA